MNNILSELQTNALTMSLITATAKSSVVLLTVWAASDLLRQKSAALRHMLWTLALASTFALLVLPAFVPAWKVLPNMTQSSAEKAALPNATLEPAAFKADIFPAEPATTSKPAKVKHAKTLDAASTRTSQAALPESFKVSLTPVSSPLTPTPKAAWWSNWRFALFALWGLGIVLCCGFYAAGELRLRKLTRTSDVVTDGQWLVLSNVIAKQLNIRRPVRLLISREIEVPLTFGVIRPVVVLSEDATEWSAHRLEAVLRHEMAHIARWDALTQIIGHAACAVYWFNPLVWFASRSARFERERACDDLVLAAGTVPSEYAGELLTMVSKFQRPERYAAALAMARKSQFEGRLLALLNPTLSRQTISRKTALWIAAVAVIFVLPLAALSSGEPVTQAAAQKIAKKPKSNSAAGAAAQTQAAQSQIAGAEALPAETPVPDAAPRAAEVSDDDVAVPAVANQVETTPTPAAAPVAAYATTVGPAQYDVAPAMAPRAAIASGTATTVRPAIDPRTGIVGPYAVSTINGTPVVAAATPRAPSRSRKVALPPPNRQTGFECSSQVDHGSSNSTSVSSDDDGRTKSMTVSWSAADCSVSLNSRGEIKYTPDFTGFQSLDSDGFVEINSRIRGDVHRLSVHSASGGGLDYVWSVNGKQSPFDDYARKWLANFLIELDRHSAWAVKQRFPALMKEGGVTRVLEEVSYMNSDYARAVYLMTVLNEVNLKQDDLILTLARVSEMSSDYETARVLMVIAAKYPLQDQASRNAFVTAIEGINSDYEHARVLVAFFDKGPLPMEMGKVLLASATRLKSDYEHARVLVAMAQKGLVDQDTQIDFLASVNGIRSDYEHARTLMAYLERRKSDDAAVLGVIRSVAQIQSPYEAARVLTAVASGRRLEGTMRDEYVRVAQGIRSDYERTRALSAVGTRPASI